MLFSSSLISNSTGNRQDTCFDTPLEHVLASSLRICSEMSDSGETYYELGGMGLCATGPCAPKQNYKVHKNNNVNS